MATSQYGSFFGSNLPRVVALCLLFCLFQTTAQAAPAAKSWIFWQQVGQRSDLPSDAEFRQFLNTYRSVNAKAIAVLDYQSVSPAALQSLKVFVSSYTALDPRELTRPAQFVYWVNLYNAQIIVQVLEAGIPASIRDIKPGLSGLLAGGPWRATQFVIAGQEVSFNDIEHRILRPLWQDARVHFVLNCASLGCPDIPAQPLTLQTTDVQLEQAAVAFMNHPRGVLMQGESVKLSSIFDWFSADFGATKTQRLAFINRYRERAINSLSDVSYHYDWSLNAP